MRLAVRFPSFGDVYDKLKMREFVSHLEGILAKIIIDTTQGAYSVTTDQTLGADDDTVLVDTTAGDVTITLPEISTAMVKLKREYAVVKPVAANTVYVDTTGADTIVGASSAVVTVQWTALRFRATTGNWVVV